MKICKHEMHGGVCKKTETYCNLSACPYEELIEVTEVVRCKDCKTCLIDNSSRQYHLCMRFGGAFPRRVDLMDFCSFGESKEK